MTPGIHRSPAQNHTEQASRTTVTVKTSGSLPLPPPPALALGEPARAESLATAESIESLGDGDDIPREISSRLDAVKNVGVRSGNERIRHPR